MGSRPNPIPSHGIFNFKSVPWDRTGWDRTGWDGKGWEGMGWNYPIPYGALIGVYYYVKFTKYRRIRIHKNKKQEYDLYTN
jgi:hypothetical protein